MNIRSTKYRILPALPDSPVQYPFSLSNVLLMLSPVSILSFSVQGVAPVQMSTLSLSSNLFHMLSPVQLSTQGLSVQCVAQAQSSEYPKLVCCPMYCSNQLQLSALSLSIQFVSHAQSSPFEYSRLVSPMCCSVC